MDYISIVLSVFLIEYIVDCLILKIFKIQYSWLYLLFLQIPKICSSMICLMYSNISWLCFLSKILSKIICIIFITDSFKIKRLASLFVTEIMLLFSVGGFLSFLLMCLNATMNDLFYKKIDKNLHFLIVFLIILYIFAFFKIVRAIEKNRFLKKFLVNVSFCLFNKHINLYGLIDSGNSLFDPLTRLPVVLVSMNVLKKFLSAEELEFLKGLNLRKIKCDTISGSGVEIPIFKIKRFVLRHGNETRKHMCMIGVVEHEFNKGKFDCLLHRDFL